MHIKFTADSFKLSYREGIIDDLKIKEKIDNKRYPISNSALYWTIKKTRIIIDIIYGALTLLYNRVYSKPFHVLVHLILIIIIRRRK